jgi:signal peptidase
VSLVLVFGSVTGRWKVVPVLSGSMEPSLHAGDLAVMVPEAASDLTVGEVIVYRIPVGDRHLEIHRIVRLQRSTAGTTVVTQGDANDGPDPWTATLQRGTVWRLSSRVPWIGRILLLLGIPVISVLCLALGAFLVVVIGLRRIWAVPSLPRGGAERLHAPDIGTVDGGG